MGTRRLLAVIAIIFGLLAAATTVSLFLWPPEEYAIGPLLVLSGILTAGLCYLAFRLWAEE